MTPRTVASLVLALALIVAGCSTEATVTFAPDGPCVVDGSAPGAYPELEALVPGRYEDRPPDTLDSGRHCSTENLGTLREAGIDEVRFAGGTWSFGGERAAALVVFQGTGLTAAELARFYRASAEAANRTQLTGESTPTLAGRPGYRLDTRTGDRTQTVAIWPSTAVDTVNVVITNDLPDPKIEAAIAAFDGR